MNGPPPRPIAFVTLMLCSGCTDIDYSEEPPEVVQISPTCTDGTLEVTITVLDDNGVSDVSVEPEMDGVEADTGADATWLASQDISYTDGGSRWTVADEIDDCEQQVELVVTATNVWGLQTTASGWWPELEAEAEGVVPEHGPDSGGTEVVIHGEDLGRTAEVWFGEAAADIVEVSRDAVTVTTPAGTEGVVDVVLSTADGEELELPGAFTYYPGAEGLYTGLLRSMVHVYDPIWFSIGSAYATIDYGPYVQMEVIFHEAIPEENHYFANHPAIGTCEWGSDSSWTAVDAGSYMVAEGPDVGELALLATSSDTPTYYYVEDNLDYELWGGEAIDVEVTSEGDVPLQVFEAVFTHPELPVDPAFDFAAVNQIVWGEDLSIDLDSTASGALVTFYPSNGSSALAAIECAVDPSVPLELGWAELVADVDESQVDGLHLAIAYYEDSIVEAEHDGSSIWGRSYIKYWTYFEAASAEVSP